MVITLDGADNGHLSIGIEFNNLAALLKFLMSKLKYKIAQWYYKVHFII